MLQKIAIFRTQTRRFLMCLLAVGVVFTAICPTDALAQLGDRTGQVFEFEEWSLTTSSAPANPFDLDAIATFTPQGGGDAVTTGMFYDGMQGGQHVYKFRFTGLQQGTAYDITTSSSNSTLNGQTGSVAINANANPNATGFLTHVGNKYAQQVGNDGQLKGYLNNVYQNFNAYDHNSVEFFGIQSNRQAYFDEIRANGSNVAFLRVNNEWFELGKQARSANAGGTFTFLSDPNGPYNPDRNTFQILEDTIQHARQEGVQVQFWSWGDDTNPGIRYATPPAENDREVLGINGAADLRYQKYLAARLAPLPGWSLGYGFDLQDWVDDDQLDAWAQNITDQSTNNHLLSARSYAAEAGPIVHDASPSNSYRANALGVNSYSTAGTHENGGTAGRGLQTELDGPITYAQVAADLDAGPDKPHFYEERFTLNRFSDTWSATTTRRTHWINAMAGGAGSWYGFFGQEFTPPINLPSEESPTSEGYNATLRNQLQTFDTFWNANDRFQLDMVRANGLTSASDHYVLKTTDDERLTVVYAEATNAITIDLSGYDQNMQVTVVNALRAYSELDWGVKSNTAGQTIMLPSGADWVVALTPTSASPWDPELPDGDITSNLIGHWKMDDLSGMIAHDSAGNNDGTLVGPPNPAFVATGKHDGAVDFQGGNGAGYVDIGDDAALNLTGSRTVSAWIKVDQWSGTAGPNYWDAIVTKGDVPGNYDLIRDGVSDRIGFYVADTGEFIASSEGVADGEWHLITGVYDVAGTISLYVDGVLDVSMVVDGGLTTTNDASLRINGLDKAGREENRHMDGLVDDVRLYDRALSAVDVAKLYSLHSVPEPSTLGLVGLAGLVFALRRKV